MYHDVVTGQGFASSGFNIKGADSYKIPEEEFRSHLELVSHYIRKQANLPPLLTFDDGGSCSLHITAALLEAFGLKGHFYIPTSFIGQKGFVTHAEIRQLSQKGHTIGSHSHTHTGMLSYKPYSFILKEWQVSKAVLEDITGLEVTTASVPGGWYNEKVKKAAAEAGFRILYTSEPVAAGPEVQGQDIQVHGRFAIKQQYDLQRLEELLKQDGELMQHLHTKWRRLERLKQLAGRPYLFLRGYGL